MDYFISDKKEKEEISNETNIIANINNDNNIVQSPLAVTIDDTNSNSVSMETTQGNSFIPNNYTSTHDTNIANNIFSSPTVQPIGTTDNEEDRDMKSPDYGLSSPLSIQSPITTQSLKEKNYQDLLLLMTLSDYENTISEADALISMSENRRFQVL